MLDAHVQQLMSLCSFFFEFGLQTLQNLQNCTLCNENLSLKCPVKK